MQPSTPNTASRAGSLANKVALITGASSGIGAELATTLAQQGIKIAAAARRQDRVDALVASIREAGGEAIGIVCDVREEEQVKVMIDQTVKTFGGIDMLFANAGFGYRSPIVDGDPQRWKAMLDTNVYGLLLTLKHGVPPIVARGQGDVFLTSSVAGHVVGQGGAAYSASKFAVNAIGEALRQEMSRKNVRVTLLAPGVVISEFQDVAGYPAGFVDNWLGGTPPLEVQDVAAAVLAVLQLPPHVSVNQLIVRPTGQTNP